ncbi:phosphatase PAP2 family protein [bacterium]|nr:phosphatase PAP2 family protein [bacterium]
MIAWLEALDVALFRFINVSAWHPFIDPVMVAVTSQDRWYAALLGGWLAMIIWGGRRGRLAAAMVVLAVTFSDQLSSGLMKPLVGRIRPCNALPLDEIRLLVRQSKAFSFPSSHAANSFSMATVLAWRYPRFIPLSLAVAVIIGYSRIYVGVHYPLDVFVGAVVGVLCGRAAILIVRAIDKWWCDRRRSAALRSEM